MTIVDQEEDETRDERPVSPANTHGPHLLLARDRRSGPRLHSLPFFAPLYPVQE